MVYYTLEERRQIKEKWIAQLEDWKKSGLNGAAWCRARGVKYDRFIHWRKRLSKRTGQHLSAESFVELAEISYSSGIEIVLNGISIRLSKNFDSIALHRCLRALKEAKC